MNLVFLGATEDVTGSKTILESRGTRILIDSGLYQGEVEPDKSQLESFKGYKLDCVLLTHAHLDHSGFLPLLMKSGFRGKIYCTSPTMKLIRIILDDALRIQMNKDESKKEIEEILFDQSHVDMVFEHIEVVEKNKEYKFKEVYFQYYEAGHILGAASVVVWDNDMKIGFSGDIGTKTDLIHFEPMSPKDLDYLVLESTYGDTIHKSNPIEEQLKSEIQKCIKKNGVLLIPCFAVARTQLIILYLYRVFKQFPHIKLPIYFDSPMAIKATDIYLENHSFTKLDKDEFLEALKMVKFSRFESVFEKARKHKPPMIVISSSGMLSGGKVLKYLDMYITHENNTILFTGFQAPGTLGHKIIGGETEIDLNGRVAHVRAELAKLEGISAHADQVELFEYAKQSKPSLRKIFLNHGETSEKLGLKKLLESDFDIPIIIAESDEVYELE